MMEKPAGAVGAAGVYRSLRERQQTAGWIERLILTKGSWITIGTALIVALLPRPRSTFRFGDLVLWAAVYGVYSLLLEWASRRHRTVYDRPWFVELRLHANLLMIGVLVAVTGGPDSPFGVYFLLPLLNVAVYPLSWRRSLGAIGEVLVVGVLAGLPYGLEMMLAYWPRLVINGSILTFVTLMTKHLIGLVNEKKRLARETVHSVEALAGELDSFDGLEPMGHAIVRQILDCTGGMRGSLMMLDRQPNKLKTVASLPPETAGTLHQEFGLGAGVAGWVALHQETVMLAEAKDHPAFIAPVTRDIQSLLSVPVRSRQRTVGVLNVEHETPGWFNENDRFLVQAYAATVAARLERTRILQVLEGLRHHAALENSEALDQILEQLAPIIHYDSASVFLMENGAVRVVSAVGHPDPRRALRVVIDPERDVLFREMSTHRRPILIADAQQDPRFRALGGTGYTRGWLGVPLLVQDTVIGCLTFDSREPSAFTDSDVQILSMFIGDIAVAIRDAQLSASRQHLETLLENAPVGVIAVDQHGRITECNPTARRLLGYSTRELAKLTVADLYYGGAAEAGRINKAIQEAGTISNVPASIRTKAGERIPIILSATKLPQGGSVGFFDSDIANVQLELALIKEVLEVVRTIGGHRGIDDALDALLHGTRNALRPIGVQSVTFYLYDMETDEFETPPAAAGVEQPENLAGPVLRDSIVYRTLAFDDVQFIGDAKTHPLTVGSAFVEREAVGALAACPLRDSGNAIGVMFCNFRSRHTFGSTEKSLIRALAELVAMAVARRRLYEGMQLQRGKATEMCRIAEALNDTLDTAEIQRLLVERAAGLIEVDACSYFAYDDESGSLVGKAGYGIGAEDVPAMVKPVDFSESAMEAIRIRRPVIVRDDDGPPRIPAELAQDYGFRTSLVVPLVHSDRVLGLLFLDHGDGARRFRQQEVELAANLAAQAAVNLEEARLYHQQTVEASELKILTELANQVGVIQSEASLLQAAAKLIGKHRGKAVRIGIIDGSQIVFDRSTTYGFRDVVPKVMVLPIHEGLSGAAVAEREVIIVPDVRVDPRCADPPPHARAEAAIPLIIGDEVIGVLDIYDDESGRLSQADPHLWTLIGKQLAVALQYVRVFRSYAALEKLNLVSRVGAFLSHRMTNLIGTLPWAIETVSAAVPAGAEGAGTHIEIIRKNVDHLMNLATELRRIPMQDVGMMSTHVNVNRWLGEAVRSVPPDGVQFVWDLAEDLPGVLASPSLLVDVFISLTDNAITAMAGGDGTLTLGTRLGDDGREVVISFEDTGCGMTEAERDHIFTPYFAEREGATGSGLALWLSKLLLESWGGDITIVRSGPGAGTCFEITLPTGVKSPAAEELPAPMAVVAPPAELAALRDGPGELGRVNALVVDDNWSWREVVSHALRQLGCSVFTATNFGEAMGMLESEPIDLAVLDIRLVDRDDTNQDGVRLAQQLSAMNPRAVSILMSGFKIPPEAQRLLDEGLVRAILDKGKQTEFLGALASALSRVDAAREMGPSPGASPRAGRPSGEGK